MSPISIVFATAILGAASATCISNGTLSNSGADCACSKLASQYGDSLLYPSSANYTEERTDYWDIRSDLLPACIFLPSDADEVANAVSVFSTCEAQFAIRGGGHMNVGFREDTLPSLVDAKTASSFQDPTTLMGASLLHLNGSTISKFPRRV